MNPEQEFIHDIANKLTIAHGKLSRIISKSDKFTKEEIIEISSKAKRELDETFELIDFRKKEIE